MPTAQINARMDAALKREGDATLARFGTNASEAIRSLWQYLAHAKELPDFMKKNEPEAIESPADAAQAEAGAGLAIRMASDAGLALANTQSVTYDELRELAFEEFLLEGRLHA